MSMYKGAKTRVQVGGGHSEEFYVGVCVYQGSVISPFMFSIVLDVLSEDGKILFSLFQQKWMYLKHAFLVLFFMEAKAGPCMRVKEPDLMHSTFVA